LTERTTVSSPNYKNTQAENEKDEEEKKIKRLTSDMNCLQAPQGHTNLSTTSLKKKKNKGT